MVLATRIPLLDETCRVDKLQYVTYETERAPWGSYSVVTYEGEGGRRGLAKA